MKEAIERVLRAAGPQPWVLKQQGKLEKAPGTSGWVLAVKCGKYQCHRDNAPSGISHEGASKADNGD